jgi:hypothetical protein
MEDFKAVPIAEAAARHNVDERRLRGAVWRENLTGELSLPIGSFAHDLVQDDETLKRWAEARARTKV